MAELKEVLRREPVSGESQGAGALVPAQDQGEGALVEVQEPDVTHQDKKRKVEPQRSQDGEAIAVDLTGEGDVEVFKARGELGKGFGASGGRPKKTQLLDSELAIVQQRQGLENRRCYRQVKERERQDTFGCRTKAQFCQMRHNASEMASDRGKLTRFFVQRTGRG